MIFTPLRGWQAQYQSNIRVALKTLEIVIEDEYCRQYFRSIIVLHQKQTMPVTNLCGVDEPIVWEFVRRDEGTRS